MISVTLLSSYLYCARKLYMEQVLGIKEPLKDVVLLGAIRHDSFEKLNLVDEEIVKSIRIKLELADIEQKYKTAAAELLRGVILKNKEQLKQFNLKPLDVFNGALPSVETEALERAKNVFSFMQKTGLLGDELWENLTPKIVAEYSINSPKLELKGRIDKLLVYDNTLTPIELKTGSLPKEGVWPGHRIQLGAYLLLLKDKTDKDATKGFIHYLDANEQRPVTLNPFLEKEITDLVKKVQLLMSSDKIPECCGCDNKCARCGLKEQCKNQK